MGRLAQAPAFYANRDTLRALIQSQSPSAYYICDEASGNLIDYSGNGFDLTPFGAPLYQNSPLLPTDPNTRYLRLPVGSNGFNVANPLAVPFNVDCAVLCLCTPLVYGGNDINVCGVGGSGETEAANFQFGLNITNAGLMQTIWESGAGTDRIVTLSGIQFEEGIPFLYAVNKQVSDTSVTFFRNGIRVGRGTYAAEPTGGTAANLGVGDASGSATNDIILGHVAFWRGSQIPVNFIAQVANMAGMLGGGN